MDEQNTFETFELDVDKVDQFVEESAEVVIEEVGGQQDAHPSENMEEGMEEGRISFSQFCKQIQKPKSSIHRLCSQLGISTSKGLSTEDREMLLKALGLSETGGEVSRVSILPQGFVATAAPELKNGAWNSSQPQGVEDLLQEYKGFDPAQALKHLGGVAHLPKGQNDDLLVVAQAMRELVQQNIAAILEQQQQLLTEEIQKTQAAQIALTGLQIDIATGAVESRIYRQLQKMQDAQARSALGNILEMGRAGGKSGDDGSDSPSS